MCNSKEPLVGYLYDELDADGRRAFETHLKTCAECRDELASLRSTRAPDGLGAARTRLRLPDRPQPRGASRDARLPGIARLGARGSRGACHGGRGRHRERRGALWQRRPCRPTGWNRGASAESDETVAPSAESVNWQATADGIDRRLRELEAIARTQPSPVQNGFASISDVEVLRRVREMLGQSETRQQRAMAIRLAELAREVDAQRRVDLAAIDQGMARLQNTSGAEVKQYRDLIQRMYRATSYQQK